LLTLSHIIDDDLAAGHLLTTEKNTGEKTGRGSGGNGLPLRGARSNYWKHEFANHRVIDRIYPHPKAVVISAVGIRIQVDAEDIYR